MRTFANLEELAGAVGEELGVSDWYEVTQDAVNLFADATGDHQWIHVDAARAAQGPFGGTIAHGYFTLSLAPVLLSQVYRLDGVKMGINYGLNKLRFVTPVRIGKRVRLRGKLLDLGPKAGGMASTIELTWEIEGEDKPAAVAEAVFLSFT